MHGACLWKGSLCWTLVTKTLVWLCRQQNVKQTGEYEYVCWSKNKQQASNSEVAIRCFEKVFFAEALLNSLQSMISTEPITALEPFLHTPILPPEFADLDAFARKIQIQVTYDQFELFHLFSLNITFLSLFLSSIYTCLLSQFRNVKQTKP